MAAPQSMAGPRSLFYARSLCAAALLLRASLAQQQPPVVTALPVVTTPLLWLGPDTLRGPPGSPVNTWPNAISYNASAPNADPLSPSVAGGPSGGAVPPSIIVDATSGRRAVRFASANATSLITQGTALDLSQASSQFAIFLVARANPSAAPLCSSGGIVPPTTQFYNLGLALTQPSPPTSRPGPPAWALGFYGAYRDVAVGCGLWLPSATGVPDGPSTTWLLYTLTRDTYGAGQLYRNGTLIPSAAGATCGPRGLALGGYNATFTNPCPTSPGNGPPQLPGSLYGNVDIGEILVFNTSLADVDRRSVEAWLGAQPEGSFVPFSGISLFETSL